MASQPVVRFLLAAGLMLALNAHADFTGKVVAVRRGLAWAYTKYLTDPQIKVIEGEARAAKSGLWHDDKPVPPWEWRKERR